jgi:NAD(P)-dependent dehydrogenase (short-subunit alcohol dehydrogenase family)
MVNGMNRRKFIAATAAGAAVTSLPACGGREPPERPPGIPLSNFGFESTAEDVTAGLDLSGMTALVTGSNSGIGYETARVLALRGARVICAARTIAKAAATSESIAGDTTTSAFDLADFDSIVAAAEKLRAAGTPIDMLVLNAGIMELPELEQVRGIERQFTVNHLGHFILTHQLLELVQAAPAGRVVVVSSGQATRNAPPEGIQFDNLSGEAGYEPGQAYGQSKLANALFSLELAERLGNGSTTSNVLRPGVIPTNLGRHMPFWKPLLLKTVGMAFTKTIPQGAATTCYVAASPIIADVRGQFFEDSNPIVAGGFTEDREMAKRLWTVSEELTAGYI